MKSYLTITFLLFFTSNLVGQVQDTVQNLSEIWQRNMEYTIQIIESLPEADFGFRPVPAMMSFAEQVIHMDKNLIFLKKLLDTNEEITSGYSSEEKVFTKSELILNLRQRMKAVERILLKTSRREWDSSVEFFDKNVQLNKFGIFLLMKDHLAHHRGQLIVYLRLKGIKPPEYRGW